MKSLSKIYSRELTLFYFCSWDRSDREGTRRFIKAEIKDNLFIVRPQGEKSEVWYSWDELNPIIDKALGRVNTDAGLRSAIARNAEEAWETLSPYFEGDKKLASVTDMRAYFDALVRFWSSMNTPLFQMLDRESLSQEFPKMLAAIRERTQEFTGRMSTNFTEYFERAFPTLADVSHHVTPEEVEHLAADPSQNFIDELKARAKEGCFMLSGTVYPLSQLDTILVQSGLQLANATQTDAGEVKGRTGFPGKVSGTARVVLSKAELGKVQEGDILVTQITDPDFMGALTKAAAFVTDEGGIMSHAAITAREMKKPCVIGTKFGTQVFKNGDMVEIDADHGIVRKI